MVCLWSARSETRRCKKHSLGRAWCKRPVHGQISRKPFLSWQRAGFPMAPVCSCERGPGVSGSRAVQVLAQVTRRPHIILWQLLCLLFAAGGHQQPLPARILLVAGPCRLSLLGSQRQQQLSTHSPLATSVSAPCCWSFPAAALSHSGPVWLQLFSANGSKWKHRATVLTSSFKIHWALQGKHPANCAEQQDTKELKERLKFEFVGWNAFVVCLWSARSETRAVRSTRSGELGASVQSMDRSAENLSRQQSLRRAVLGLPVMARGRVPHGPCLQL